MTLILSSALLSLAAPVIKQVVPSIIEKIKNKISPGEFQQAIIVGIKAAEAEEEKLSYEQRLFHTSKPDSIQGVPGFLAKYLNVSGVQNELAKPFDEGLPDINYLAEEFERVAANFDLVNPKVDRIEPWLDMFIQIYFQESTNYLKFKVAKENYFKQLNKRYDGVKFAGIAVSGQEEKPKQLKQIFVMPDVIKREENTLSFIPKFESAQQLTPQQQLILEQKQLAKLSKTYSNSFLADKLLTENKSKKAVILGAPGSGKSTLISYFAVMLAQKNANELGLDDNDDWLPIVIEIRDLEKNLNLSFIEYLYKFAQSNLATNELPEDFFRHWLNRGKALILLDGIDEVAETNKRYDVVERIELFLNNQHPDNITIITSRPSGYKRDFFSTAEFPHYQLQPFDDDKIEEFIDHWYDSRTDDPQEAARCKKTLLKAIGDNDRIKLLAKNPLLITIIALIHRYQAYLPKERHKLYDKAVETLLTAWDKKKEISGHKVLKYLYLDDLRHLLESLARWIHSKGSTGDREGGTQIDKEELLEWLCKYIKTNKQKERYEAKEEAKRFLTFIRERTGLLNEQGTNRYAFVHKTFQEYLCTQDVNYEADDEDDFAIVLNCIKEHLHDAHWREVLLLLVAQQKPQKALRAIKIIYENKSQYEQWLHRDLLFAGSCLADSSRGIKFKDKGGLAYKILNALINLEAEDEYKIGDKVREQVFKIISSLAETEWEQDALNLLKQQKDKVQQFRFIEYQAALGETRQAMATLLSLINDDDFDVNFSAVFALRKIGKDEPQVIEALLSLLHDGDSQMVFFAVLVLKKISKSEPRVIETLLSLLDDDDSKVRYRAASALKEIGNSEPRVTETLLSLLDDNNSDVRYRAASTLKEIGNSEPRIIEALIPLLNDDDSNVRYGAASTLKEIGNSEPRVIETLLSLLDDDDSDIRFFAAFTLKEIGNSEPRVIETLLSLLHDDDSNMRFVIASILRETENSEPRIIEALIPLLNDDDSNVRYRAASTLGEIGKNEPRVIEALIPLLNDDDSNMRYRAASTLGEIGKNEPRVIETLISLLDDKDSNVRYGAASTLKKMGNSKPRVIETLISLLDNKDSNVRYGAASTLSEIGKNEPQMTNLIVNWLEKHQDTEYAGNGIDVLWGLVADD